MKRLLARLYRLPLKIRLMLVSSSLLLVWIACTSLVIYVILDRQLLDQQQDTIRRTMNELQSYYQEKQTDLTVEQIQSSQTFLHSLKQSDQLIRILDREGRPIVTVTDHLPEEWVKPVPVKQTKIIKGHLLTMRSPLEVGSFTGTIEIVRNMEAFDRMKDTVLTTLLFTAAGAVAVSLFGARHLVRQLLRPIRSLIATMQNVHHRGFHERVEVPKQQDEFTALALMFNGMMDEVERALRQQQQFVEDASHELRTPIAILEGHLGLLNRWGKHNPQVLEDSLGASLDELGRLKALVLELLELTRADRTGPGREIPLIAPEPVLGNWLPHFQSIHPGFDFEVDLSGWEGLRLRMLPRHLEQTAAILLDNAVKYSPHTRRIRIEGSRSDGHLELRIRDSGIGIPEADLPYVFQRFYRADKARSREMGGSGLGLSIADRLVRMYDGTIGLSSVEGVGTTATVRLPLAEGEKTPYH